MIQPNSRDTTTYCKNYYVLFAALWTKLSILSQNRGNLYKKKFMLPDNIGLATLTSLLPHFPLERLSCHVCEDVCRNCHVNISISTLTSLFPHFPLERRSCHIFHWNVTLAMFVKMYVTISTLTSVLPRFPLELRSCHVFHWNVTITTFLKMYVTIAMLTSDLPP